MKNIFKKIAVFVLAAMIMMPAAIAEVSAASTVSVTGGDQVKGGEVFTVTVTYDGDSIGRVVGDVTYDTSMLSYISGGSSSGNVGYIELRTAGTGEPLTFKIKFQALREGSTQLEVSTSEMYDLNEMYMDTPSASKTVTISGNADEEEIVEETMAEDDAADEGLSVDENTNIDSTASNEDVAGDGQDDEADKSGFLAKAIMFGVGILVLILILVAILRRKK